MSNQNLTAKQQSIVTIAAFTANGNMEELKIASNEGLNAGLTVNEIKEVLVQMYAYCGFPRSLNGINTFMGVMGERQTKGIKDEMGLEAAPMPSDLNRNEYGENVRLKLSGRATASPPSGYQVFIPVIDDLLKEHLFADIFYRDNLDYLEREIATVAALASMTGTNAQLRFHMGAAMNVGLTEAQMQDLISVLGLRLGKERGDNAAEIFKQVLSSRAK